MIHRLGTNEQEKEGVVIELYAGRKVAVRAWYRENGQTRLIPAEHYDIQEIADFLGLQVPEKPRRRAGEGKG